MATARRFAARSEGISRCVGRLLLLGIGLYGYMVDMVI